MSQASKFKLGFLTHVEGGASLKQSYLNAQELFIAADELGFDTGWVAQHHFSPEPNGGLGSPWTFLSNVAAKTERIHLGTAITILPLEDPLRLAEDVAVVDVLSNGRVELGVGSGYDPDAYRAFGKDIEQKRELTTAALDRLRSALAGHPLFEGGPQSKPYSPDLAANRIWQGVFSAEGARYAAAGGSNLLLNRATYGHSEPTDVVQRPWADAYLAAVAEQSGSAQSDSDGAVARRAPRVGLSRLIFTAGSREEALRSIGDGVLDSLVSMKKRSGFDLGEESLENALFRFNAFYGHPDQVIEQLSREQALPVATDLLAQFNPGKPTLDASIRALELLATEVAPALGWVRADAAASGLDVSANDAGANDLSTPDRSTPNEALATV
ncbi:LLM class flavin-dependent oxidoreductase [Subtercola lobariae]|uniref:Luciferase n=1 Tax=Subtercola lobariae TaxID=1588641 RepID=A0A917EVU1_9MICO|nr:LLM class flavin-dependent oxidoreductase [Subtercola lobariae]GGF22057.1 luciferase [Subtercola lobariae]